MPNSERATVARSLGYLERATADRSPDYQVVISGTPDLPLNFNRPDPWKPVKDLERNILSSGEALGHVNILGGNGIKRHAFCHVKSREAALKIMDCVAGNTWFGSRLDVMVFENGNTPMQAIGWRNISSWPHPIPLDELHPTKDLVSISPVTYASSISSPPVGNGSYPGSRGSIGRPRVFSMPGDGSMTSSHYAPLTTGISLPTDFALFDSLCPPNWWQPLQDQTQGVFGLQPWVWPYQSYSTPSTPVQAPQGPRLISMPYHLSHFVPQPSQQSAFPTNYPLGLVQHGPNCDPPKYHANSNGLPVNITRGSVPVQPHGIHVRNLNHDVTPEDVECYFRPAGEIEQCEVKRNRNTKQTTAVVSFRTSRQAQTAVVRFHGTNFMGRKIGVKTDNDTVAPDGVRGITDPTRPLHSQPESPSRQGPIIVNGSGDDFSLEAAPSSVSSSSGRGKGEGETNENEDVKALAKKTRKLKLSK